MRVKQTLSDPEDGGKVRVIPDKTFNYFHTANPNSNLIGMDSKLKTVDDQIYGMFVLDRNKTAEDIKVFV